MATLARGAGPRAELASLTGFDCSSGVHRVYPVLVPSAVCAQLPNQPYTQRFNMHGSTAARQHTMQAEKMQDEKLAWHSLQSSAFTAAKDTTDAQTQFSATEPTDS